jgi:hypothetical protein
VLKNAAEPPGHKLERWRSQHRAGRGVRSAGRAPVGHGDRLGEVPPSSSFRPSSPPKGGQVSGCCSCAVLQRHGFAYHRRHWARPYASTSGSRPRRAPEPDHRRGTSAAASPAVAHIRRPRPSVVSGLLKETSDCRQRQRRQSFVVSAPTRREWASAERQHPMASMPNHGDDDAAGACLVATVAEREREQLPPWTKRADVQQRPPVFRRG